MYTHYRFKTVASLLMALAVALLLTGCFGGPSDDIVKQAIEKHEPMIKKDIFYNLVDYKVTNQYSREINGETVHTVDYTGNITASANIRRQFPRAPDLERTIKGTVSMVKRGDVWYFVN